MRIGRWSELSVDRVSQEHEVMREVGANETSGKLGSAFGGTLVRLYQLSIPWLPRHFKVWKDTSKQEWRCGSTTSTFRARLGEELAEKMFSILIG